jgi:hypothetical protein
MGPIIILDKSTLQGLSHNELTFLDKHYFLNIPPVLVAEILGDLTKQRREGKPLPGDVVALLSRKLGGLDRIVSLPYRVICLRNLLGQPLPRHRQVVVGPSRRVVTKGGVVGQWIDELPEEAALRHWGAGRFSEVERLLSAAWRAAATSVDHSLYVKRLSRFHVILPAASTLDEAVSSVDAVLGKQPLQVPLLSLLLEDLGCSQEEAHAVQNRWSQLKPQFIRSFAPYAEFCLRALLLFVVASRNDLIGQRATNRVDLEYLFYLPFCMVFSSNDVFHRCLAPLLLEADQDFVLAEELKNDLAMIADRWAGLTEEEKLEREYQYGCSPPEVESSPTACLWRKHMRPWQPGSGNIAVKFTPEQHARLLEKLRQYTDAVNRGDNRDQDEK